jgi:hypothetical protein
MKVFKLFLTFLTAASFLTACNPLQRSGIYDEPYPVGTVQDGPGYDQENYRLPRENLDLQAVGALLERADNAEEFEYLLNDPENGVNNLDLNGDGYTDYISVREFGDQYDDERGFSLFDMFGPDLIQEIATIIFDRDNYNNDYNNGYYPGARVLLRGDEDLYGDNYYYETNWLDRTIPIVTWIFSNRDGSYNSPYYYENYPSYYEPYEIVETPVYRTRIEQYYTTPIFVQTTQPTVTEVKIVSPYKDKSLKKVYAKLPKMPKEQRAEFKRNNPGPPDFVREKQERTKDFSVKENKQFRENPNKFEKPERPQPMREKREKPNKQERMNVQRQNPVKFERPPQPARVERQNQPKFERRQPMRVERQNPVRMERPQPQQMKPQKQQNRPQPNGNGGGKGNGGGGNNRGGGKGKGKP